MPQQEEEKIVESKT